MKLLVILCVLGCASWGTLAQTNYLVNSHEAAMNVHAYYEEEIAYWREKLTYEAKDMGNDYTDLVADALAEATTEQQGRGISSCAADAEWKSRINIDFFDLVIQDAEEEAHKLHSSVWTHLQEVNVKETDWELFYYYHNYVVQEFYDHLWDFHFIDMFDAWIHVMAGYYYAFDELFECLHDVLYTK